jgi:hypothetical protein
MERKLDKALKDFVSPVASGAIKSITISTGDFECKIDKEKADAIIENKTTSHNKEAAKSKPSLPIEAVISANKFLDLLCCVVPAASSDQTRPYICCVKLEILAKDYAIRAIATDGRAMSVAQRNLGFEIQDQTDLEDIENKKNLQDAEWSISTIDVEILIMALKKLGVKRGEEDETGGKYYIVIRESGEEKKKLSISILGLSHVILEPEIAIIEYPNWKQIVPKSTQPTEFASFDLAVLAILNKCWGKEKVLIAFNKEGLAKVSRLSNEEEELKDFIVLMPIKFTETEKEKIDENQMSFLD